MNPHLSARTHRLLEKVHRYSRVFLLGLNAICDIQLSLRELAEQAGIRVVIDVVSLTDLAHQLAFGATGGVQGVLLRATLRLVLSATADKPSRGARPDSLLRRRRQWPAWFRGREARLRARTRLALGRVPMRTHAEE